MDGAASRTARARLGAFKGYAHGCAGLKRPVREGVSRARSTALHAPGTITRKQSALRAVSYSRALFLECRGHRVRRRTPTSRERLRRRPRTPRWSQLRSAAGCEHPDTGAPQERRTHQKPDNPPQNAPNFSQYFMGDTAQCRVLRIHGASRVSVRDDSHGDPGNRRFTNRESGRHSCRRPGIGARGD